MPGLSTEAVSTPPASAEGEPAPEEPTQDDYTVAYELLKRPVPWQLSPVQHVARIVARYRRKSLVAHGVEAPP